MFKFPVQGANKFLLNTAYQSSHTILVACLLLILFSSWNTENVCPSNLQLCLLIYNASNIIIFNVWFGLFTFFRSAVVATAWHPNGSCMVSCDKNKHIVLWTDI